MGEEATIMGHIISKTAEHRPALRRRRFRHDNPTALDLFSGFGGFTQGIEAAGFDTIVGANHNRYKVEVHEANHPHVEHWIADLINTDSDTYHSVRELPAADLLVAGVTCTNHSQANTQRAYEQGLTLFDLDDPEFEERATRSERDRATANCVLHYADQHHPLLILVECTTELQSWGPAVPGRRKVGDGSTYRWWLREITKLGYEHKVLYLNSMFFGVPQSRDRLYIVFWDRTLPAPDLDHRPQAWCGPCDEAVEAMWAWKTGVPASGSVRYGKQYNYRCPRCFGEVSPTATPSLTALDLTHLGTRIGERTKPLAPATMARAERCRQKFAEFPAVLMPAKAQRGVERHPLQPMATQTSQQKTALLSTGAIMVAAGNTFERPGSQCRTRTLGQPLWTQPATNTTGLLTPPVAMAINNFQGAPRGLDEALPTQGGSETLSIVSSGVVPFRKHTTPTSHAQAMPTITAEQTPGLLTATGDPALLAGWFKQNGSTGTETAAHPLTDPLGTLTSRDTTALLASHWRDALADIPLDECFFRMMTPHEVGRGCGFDPDFGDHKGTFTVWGKGRDQIDGYGNAVTPPVPLWIGTRLREVLHPTSG
ncbi:MULTISPECIES: DNA cytosine methyltransferase [Gordonia]|uniref:DNA (cytosine-5-)-methyltransferase n=3 Tax=Gordoniaceae TaxID=85026 RepID=W9DIK2_9ACTN|nr:MULTISPECIES: DNA cytosine methyltransferase [Gordonia]ETA06185.1 DNA methyltransferase [Gordonia alkanivorans CGMCC 6845]MDH3013122.1 DNA cytosine methyltransferase [Gordonia alkanivorans]